MQKSEEEADEWTEMSVQPNAIEVFDDEKRRMNMQIVPIVPTIPEFELPDGWIVEVRPRGKCSSVQSDKYYYEPGTDRQFRSLISVKRYLTGEENVTVPRKKPCNNRSLVPYRSSIQNPCASRRIVYGGKVRSKVLLHFPRQELSQFIFSPFKHGGVQKAKIFRKLYPFTEHQMSIKFLFRRFKE